MQNSHSLLGLVPVYYFINIGLSPVTYSTSVWKMKLYFPNGGAVRNGTKTNINEIIYRNCESALRRNERFFAALRFRNEYVSG